MGRGTGSRAGGPDGHGAAGGGAPAEVLQVLRPSPPRRVIGAAMQGALGLFVIWIALSAPPAAFGWRVFLLGVGAAALTLAMRGWRGSAGALVLRADGLWDEDGRPVAPLDEVRDVDRALFSFKPSNGFLIRMRRPLGRAWVPGMWWRIGARVGVGGVLSGADAKAAADILSALVERRDEEADRTP